MMIMSFKLTKTRAVICVAATAAILAGVITIISQKNITAAANIGIKSVTVKTDEERISYIEGFGWSVDPEPVLIREILLPKEMDEILAAYNEIQKRQGFDFQKYLGRRVKQWTYNISNYPGNHSSEVYANIYTYKEKVIGGDISSAEMDGFIHEMNKFS